MYIEWPFSNMGTTVWGDAYPDYDARMEAIKRSTRWWFNRLNEE